MARRTTKREKQHLKARRAALKGWRTRRKNALSAKLSAAGKAVWEQRRALAALGKAKSQVSAYFRKNKLGRDRYLARASLKAPVFRSTQFKTKGIRTTAFRYFDHLEDELRSGNTILRLFDELKEHVDRAEPYGKRLWGYGVIMETTDEDEHTGHHFRNVPLPMKENLGTAKLEARDIISEVLFNDMFSLNRNGYLKPGTDSRFVGIFASSFRFAPKAKKRREKR